MYGPGLSECGASEDCIEKNSLCEYDYDYDKTEYTRCLSSNIFGDSRVFYSLPEDMKNSYLDDFYKAITSMDYSEKIKDLYFEFILDILKLSYNEESYIGLYENVLNSVIVDIKQVKSDIEKGKIDIFEIKYAKFDNSEEKAFYNYIGHIAEENKTVDLECLRSVINFNGNYNEELFYNVINEKFFQNKLTNEEIRFIIENRNDYNLQGLFFRIRDNENISNKEEYIRNITIGIVELNKFLVDYDSFNYKNIIDNIYNIQ